MAKQKIPVKDDTDARRTAEQAKSSRGGSRLRWLGLRLLVAFVLLAVLVFCAPLIVGGMGLWKTILATAAPPLAKQITAGSIELSWLSPIEIRGLAVRDADGQPLAEITRIRSHKTLLALAAGYPDLGTFAVEEPRVKLVLRPDGSNVEDLLAKLPKSESSNKPGKPSNVGVGLALTKGMVDLDDQVAGRR